MAWFALTIRSFGGLGLDEIYTDTDLDTYIHACLWAKYVGCVVAGGVKVSVKCRGTEAISQLVSLVEGAALLLGSSGHTARYSVGFWGWWLWDIYMTSWVAFTFSKQSLLPKRNSLMEWFQHWTQKMLPEQKLNYFHSFNELCHLQWCFPRESPPCIMAFIEYYICEELSKAV